MSEPEKKFAFNQYYCAHCPLDPRAESWTSKYQVVNHVYSEHGENQPVEGDDYYQGWHAQKKFNARKTVANSFRYPAFGDPNYGLDDFLADAGLEGPEEPPCDPGPRREDGKAA